MMKEKRGKIVLSCKDLLRHWLLRRRSIVAVMLIAAVLAAGVKYLVDRRENVVPELTPTAMANVQDVVNYRLAYQKMVAYNTESLYMQIDPASVPTEDITYLLTGDDAFANASLYAKLIGNENMYAAIADSLKWELAPSYIAELVTATVESDPASGDDDHGALLCLRVIAPTKGKCRVIAEALMAQVEALQPTVKDAIGNHTVKTTGNTFFYSADASVRTAQQANINACDTLRTELAAATEALSAEELAAADALEQGTTVKPARTSFSVIYLLVGAVIGLAVMLVLYLIGYLLDRRLKSVTDAEKRFGLVTLGVVGEPALPGNRPDAAIMRALTPAVTSPADYLATMVSVIGRKMASGAHSLVLVGQFPAEQPTVTQATEQLQAGGIPATVAGCPLSDPRAAEQLDDADAVVLLAQIGATRYDEIDRELALCATLQKPVLGMIVLQDTAE